MVFSYSLPGRRRSFRRSRVRFNASSSRQRAIRPWSPETRTSGTFIPRKTEGLVYCGNSSRPFLERLPQRRLRVAEGPRDQPHHALDDRHRRHFPARENVVTDGHFLETEAGADPLVETLVPPAEKHDALRPRQGPEIALHETLPLGAEEDLARPIRRGAFRHCASRATEDRLHRPEDRLRLEDHPRTAAIGLIVDRTMPVGREVAQVGEVDLHELRPARPGDDRLPQEALEHRGEDRDDVDPQCHDRTFP